MNRKASAFLMLVVVALPLTASTTSTAPPCQNSAELSDALSNVRRNWPSLDAEKLQSLWPKPLRTLQDNGDGVLLIGSDGPMVGTHCLCCESFDFDISTNKRGGQKQELRTVAIQYSALKRENAISEAKKFATALGAPSSQLESIGASQSGDVSWEEGRTRDARVLWGIHFEFYTTGRDWTAHLLASRYDLNRDEHLDVAAEHNYVPAEGYVPDEATALKVAEVILNRIYGEDVIARQKPLKASLDGEVWTVVGTFAGAKWHQKGGIALLQLSKSDARVIRVTHGK